MAWRTPSLWGLRLCSMCLRPTALTNSARFASGGQSAMRPGNRFPGSSTILYRRNPFSYCILSAIFPASCSCICCPNRLNRLTLHRICQKRRMKLPEATRSKIYSRTNCSSLICFWRSSFSARTRSTPVICRCF